MDLKALPVLRKNLKEFIKADAREIVLERPTKKKTPNGAWIEGDLEPLPPQTFRLVPAKRRLGEPEVNSQDGAIPFGAWVLVGGIEVDIRRDDEFTHHGDRYKVIAVAPKTDDRSTTDRVVAQLEIRPNPS